MNSSASTLWKLFQEHAGTCEWFLTSPERSAWKQKQHRVLYCSTIGGAGKTIVAFITIGDLRMATARHDTATFVIYCKHDRPDIHYADKVAMTILRQLVQLKACQIPPDLEELLGRHFHTNETRPSLDEALKVINAHLSTFSRAFIVVDELDEFMKVGARECIITFSMKLEAAPQLMFTSRPIEMIEKMFLSTTYENETDDTALTDGGESDVFRNDEDTEYDCDHDLYNEGIEEKDPSDESSDQNSSESPGKKDPQSPVRAPPIVPDKSLFSSENSSKHKDENSLPCSKCNKQLSLLQYHCFKCLRSRSILCVAWDDSGT